MTQEQAERLLQLLASILNELRQMSGNINRIPARMGH